MRQIRRKFFWIKRMLSNKNCGTHLNLNHFGCCNKSAIIRRCNRCNNVCGLSEHVVAHTSCKHGQWKHCSTQTFFIPNGFFFCYKRVEEEGWYFVAVVVVYILLVLNFIFVYWAFRGALSSFVQWQIRYGSSQATVAHVVVILTVGISAMYCSYIILFALHWTSAIIWIESVRHNTFIGQLDFVARIQHEWINAMRKCWTKQHWNERERTTHRERSRGRAM